MPSGKTLEKSIRELLQAYVHKQTTTTATTEEGADHVPVDVYRILHEESGLLYQTQCVRDMILSDPFQRLFPCENNDDEKESSAASRRSSQIHNFRNSLQVVEYQRTETHFNYARIKAVVEWNYHKSNKKSKGNKKENDIKPSATPSQKIQLSFLYELRPPCCNTSADHEDENSNNHNETEDDNRQPPPPTNIWFSIDLSCDHGKKERLVVVQVWADRDSPSQLPAICCNVMEDDDSWEVTEYDEEGEEEQEPKDAEEIETSDQRKRKRKKASNEGNDDENDDDDDVNDSRSKGNKKKHNKKSKNLKNDDSSSSAVPVKDKNHGNHSQKKRHKDDKDDDNHNPTLERSNGTKKSKPCGNSQSTSPTSRVDNNSDSNEDSEEEEDIPIVDDDNAAMLSGGGDRYTTFLDPDILANFIKYAHLTSVDEATAFFLLMSFPFYEPEWDLPGFVLESVFGYESDEDDEEEE